MFIFVVQGRESSRQLLEGGPGFGVLQGRLCGSWKRETAASRPLRPPSLAVLTGTLRRTFSLWQMVWVPAVRLTPSTLALLLSHKSAILFSSQGALWNPTWGPWAGSAFLFCFDAIPRVKVTQRTRHVSPPGTPLSDRTKSLPRGTGWLPTVLISLFDR